MERNVTKCDGGGGGRGVKFRHFCVTSFVEAPLLNHALKYLLY